jgi:hypothetical protein
MAAVICVSASSQTSTQRILIKGGSEARDNFMKEMFLYPSFESGIVEYKNGQRFKSKMNYNRVISAIQFIDEKGDTLALADESNINAVNVGSDLFVYGPSLCLIGVKTDGKTRLFKSERIRIADKQKTGGYGIPNSTGTIESIDRLDTKLDWHTLDLNESLLISKVTTYYIESATGELVPASRKNILALYPAKDEEVKTYIKANHLDFNKENDLITISGFLSTL